MIEVSVTFTTRTGSIGARLFSLAAETTLRMERRRSAAVSIVVVDDATIRQINRDFLGHDYETDVITFPLEESGVLEGEIYLSAETARLQAEEYGVPLRDEFTRLTAHGVLHLCGYDDGTEADRARMRAREDAVLAAVTRASRKRS